MKLILGILTIALFSGLCWANITSDQEFLLNHQGSVAQKVQLGTLVNKTSNLLVAKYSYAVQGGSTVADIQLLTDLKNSRSYAILPNKAIITNAYAEILTAPTILGIASTTNFSIKAQTSADLLASTAGPLLTAARIIQGVPAGTTTTFIKLTADRNVKMTISSVNSPSGITAGKWNLYIHYILGD